MQQESEKFSEYSERTEVLAKNLGVNLSDLPVKIGVSNSMFHAYRSGKYPISGKAWRKLEQAEEAHARTHLEMAGEMIKRLSDSANIAESSADPKQPDVRESAYVVREEPVPYRVREPGDGHRPPLQDDPVAAAFAKIREGLDLLEQLMKNPKP